MLGRPAQLTPVADRLRFGSDFLSRSPWGGNGVMFAGAFSPAWRAAQNRVSELKGSGSAFLDIAGGDGAAGTRAPVQRCETVAAVADEGDDYEMSLEAARTLIGAGHRIIGFAMGAAVAASAACAVWLLF